MDGGFGVLSSEDSSCPDEYELELGLGLSLVGVKAQKGSRDQYARIFTPKDLPSDRSSPSSSSSSSTLSTANVAAGTKRGADSVAAGTGASSSQFVGWPPVGVYRMNSLGNQVKPPPSKVFNSVVEQSKSKNSASAKTNNGTDKNIANTKENGHHRSSQLVKVNMDGILFGRKVDLNAHSCYGTLAQALENMFQCPAMTITSTWSGGDENGVMVGATRPSKLLDESSAFVLTYQDKDHDWMLVGDVPWGMFLGSVNRLKIMRTSEANGLGM